MRPKERQSEGTPLPVPRLSSAPLRGWERGVLPPCSPCRTSSASCRRAACRGGEAAAGAGRSRAGGRSAPSCRPLPPPAPAPAAGLRPPPPRPRRAGCAPGRRRVPAARSDSAPWPPAAAPPSWCRPAPPLAACRLPPPSPPHRCGRRRPLSRTGAALSRAFRQRAAELG